MDLDALRALVTVVEMGSFVGASRRLRVARPTLRRRLESLEAEIGVPLLVRTRAGSQPTEAGRLMVQRGRELLRDGTALVAAAREVGGEPQGELRVVLPVGVAPVIVATMMSSIRQRYPKLLLRLQTNADPMAALESGVDAAISFGDQPPGGRWVAVEVGRVRQRLMGSPAYLERTGMPSVLSDLSEHELLSWSMPGDDPTQWSTLDGETIDVVPALVSPDIHLLRQVAAAGLGLAFVPDADLPELGPPLVPVLDEVLGTFRPLQLVVPASIEGLPRIRAFVSEIRRLVAAIMSGHNEPKR